MINMVKRIFPEQAIGLRMRKISVGRPFTTSIPPRQLFSSSVVFRTFLHKRKERSDEEKNRLGTSRKRLKDLYKGSFFVFCFPLKREIQDEVEN